MDNSPIGQSFSLIIIEKKAIRWKQVPGGRSEYLIPFEEKTNQTRLDLDFETACLMSRKYKWKFTTSFNKISRVAIRGN